MAHIKNKQTNNTLKKKKEGNGDTMFGYCSTTRQDKTAGGGRGDGTTFLCFISLGLLGQKFDALVLSFSIPLLKNKIIHENIYLSGQIISMICFNYITLKNFGICCFLVVSIQKQLTKLTSINKFLIVFSLLKLLLFW